MALRVSASMTLLVMGCGALLALAVRGRLTRARQAGYAVLHGIERSPRRHQRLPREHEDRQGVRRRGASRRGVQPPVAHRRRRRTCGGRGGRRHASVAQHRLGSAPRRHRLRRAHRGWDVGGVALPADVSFRAPGPAAHEPVRQAAVVRGRAARLRSRCRGGGQSAGRGRAAGGSAPRDLARPQHRSGRPELQLRRIGHPRRARPRRPVAGGARNHRDRRALGRGEEHDGRSADGSRDADRRRRHDRRCSR